MHNEYTVYLLDNDGKIIKGFTYTDYDDVSNLIGYMVEGTKVLRFIIDREEVEEDGK